MRGTLGKRLVGAAPVALLVVLLAAPVPRLAADDKDATEKDPHPALQLLERTWSGGLKARREADLIYKAAAFEGEFDADLIAAATIVRVRQHRYSEALEGAKNWVRVKPDSLHAHRARAWLSTLAREYEQALVYLEAYAAAIAAAPEAERAEHARFLGLIVGYLESTEVEKVTIEQVRGSAERSERALGAATAPYLEARRDVLRKHTALVARKDATVAATESAAQAERDRKLREIEARRAALATRGNELRNDQAKLQKELQDRLDEVTARLRPLNDALNRVDANGRAINYDLASIIAEISYLESLLAYVEDPVLRDRYYRDILRLDRLASQYELDAYRLERQADAINNDRAVVVSQGRSARDRLDRQLEQTSEELERIRNAQRRADIEERRALRPDRAASRQNRVYGAQIESLTTYAPFPLERERARMLKELRSR